MTINGGTITGETGIELRSGTLNINGGTIRGVGDPFDTDPNGNGTTTIGAALAISQHTTDLDINVKIDGGTFEGYYALYEADLQNEKTDNIALEITNGTFNGKIYSENLKDFIKGGTYSDPTALHYLGDGANVSVNLQADYAGETGTANKKAFDIGENRTVSMDLGGHKFSMTEAGNTSAGNVSITNGVLNVEKDLTVTGGILSFSDNGKMTIASNAIATFNNGSILEVDGNEIASANATPIITVKNGGTLTVDSDATLRVNNPVAGVTYNVVDGSSSAWQNIEASSDMVKLTMNTDGNLTGEIQDATSVFSGLSGEAGSLVSDLYHLQDTRNTTESPFPGIKFLRRATDKNYLGSDRKAAASTIESAARIAFAGAVPQMTKMASDAATNAVVNRLGFANPDNGAKAMNVDGKLVDDKALGLALWIAPLWSNQTGFGMEAGNLDYGYNANLGGISLGADYTWANNIRAGLMFNIGGGYAESAGGDLSETTNSMTFWGVGAYGGWEYNNFAVMADVSYTSTWNSVDQDLDHRMQMSDLEADIQASAISAGLRFEYKLETQYLDLIPHVGVRYMSINTWGYDVDSSDGTILEGDGFQQNIWTFPVGITFSKEIEMNNDWYFKPAVDFTVIPAAGDIKAKEDVLFTGMQRSYELETQMMDYFTWQGGLGLEFGNDNMSVGVNYTLQAGQNSTGHGVFGMFRYEF